MRAGADNHPTGHEFDLRHVAVVQCVRDVGSLVSLAVTLDPVACPSGWLVRPRWPPSTKKSCVMSNMKMRET